CPLTASPLQVRALLRCKLLKLKRQELRHTGTNRFSNLFKRQTQACPLITQMGEITTERTYIKLFAIYGHNLATAIMTAGHTNTVTKRRLAALRTYNSERAF